MTKSFEDNLQGEHPRPNVNISVIKYFWQRSPLSGHKTDAIPNFLREINVLKNFTDLELRTFSKYLHRRSFQAGEVIFREHELGMGFYFLLRGHIDLYASASHTESAKEAGDSDQVRVASLEKEDYFGEIALLQPRSRRTATAISRNHSVLLGIFRPDIEEMIDEHPTVGAKLLQSISLIVANRFTSVAEELKFLKSRYYKAIHQGAEK